MATENNPQVKQVMGEHIKQMLADREWTQDQLSKAARIDPGTLSQRLRGFNEFRAGELLAIALAFKVELTDLFPPSIRFYENDDLPGDQAQRPLWLDGGRSDLVHSAA